jgi:hypothetical protein
MSQPLDRFLNEIDHTCTDTLEESHRVSNQLDRSDDSKNALNELLPVVLHNGLAEDFVSIVNVF